MKWIELNSMVPLALAKLAPKALLQVGSYDLH
jgi:hypothetical protein